MQRRERGPKDVARAGGRGLETSVTYGVSIYCTHIYIYIYIYIYTIYIMYIYIYYNVYNMYTGKYVEISYIYMYMYVL